LAQAFVAEAISEIAPVQIPEVFHFDTMGQSVSECKPCFSGIPEADTVKVDVNFNPACGQKEDSSQGDKDSDVRQKKEEQQEAEEKARREAEERSLEEKRLEKERLEGEQRLAEEQAEETRRRAEEEERVRQQQEVAHKQAEKEKAEEAKRQRQVERERAAEAERLKVEEARAASAKVQAEAAAAQQAVDKFLKARGFKQLALPRKAMCGAGVYPIHQAVEENNVEVVQAMLKCGADMQQKNSIKKTPLEFAEKCNKNGSHDPVVKALRGES